MIVPCYYITHFGCLWDLLYTFISFLGLTYYPEAQPILLFFAYFSVLKKRNIKWSPNGMKPSGQLFLERKQSRRLGVDVREASRKPQGREARPPIPCLPRAFPGLNSKSPESYPSKNHAPTGFIPFGLHLIFLFFEILKQAIKQEYGSGLRLIG